MTFLLLHQIHKWLSPSLVTTNFDGVGILGTITLTIEYLEGWNDITSLALSGDNLAVSMDAIQYNREFIVKIHLATTKACFHRRYRSRGL